MERVLRDEEPYAAPVPAGGRSPTMATWIIGDIHGCADELHALVERIAPGPGDALVACGDLLHRGPDPAGVCDVLAAAGARFLIGNHELAVLRRVGVAPSRHDGTDRRPLPDELPDLDADDLAGDGRRPCHVAAERRAEVLRFLEGHSGYLLRSTDLDGAGPTPDGRDWLVVHAGFDPRRRPEDQPAETLCTIRRLRDLRGKPYWYERWHGPELVLFGHTHSPLPRVHARGSTALAIGLDTGCVYGGALTAYSPERDEFVRVPARSGATGAVA